MVELTRFEWRVACLGVGYQLDHQFVDRVDGIPADVVSGIDVANFFAALSHASDEIGRVKHFEMLSERVYVDGANRNCQARLFNAVAYESIILESQPIVTYEMDRIQFAEKAVDSIVFVDDEETARYCERAFGWDVASDLGDAHTVIYREIPHNYGMDEEEMLLDRVSTYVTEYIPVPGIVQRNGGKLVLYGNFTMILCAVSVSVFPAVIVLWAVLLIFTIVLWLHDDVPVMRNS